MVAVGERLALVTILDGCGGQGGQGSGARIGSASNQSITQVSQTEIPTEIETEMKVLRSHIGRGDRVRRGRWQVDQRRSRHVSSRDTGYQSVVKKLRSSELRSSELRS